MRCRLGFHDWRVLTWDQRRIGVVCERCGTERMDRWPS